jgi:phosphatidylserine synthase 2
MWLVYMLFQDLDTARYSMTYIDLGLNRPLPEKNYAEDCNINSETLKA